MNWKHLLLITLIPFSLSAQTKSDISANFWLKHFIENGADTVKSVGVFVKGSPTDAKEFVEVNQGIYRGSVKGWQYIRIPGKSLKKLVVDDRFSYVDYSPYKGVPMNDTMRVNNRINAIHTGEQMLSPYTGAGTVVGFIDTGIDFLHPDFRDTNDKTRILHIWDQSLGNNAYTPSTYGYGRHWDSAQINAGLCTNHDIYGHGSTVAGAASGNGLANGTHMGVAPDSYIIAVESRFNASDWLATVVDATEYIFNYADSNNLPCVINASVGTYLGSHDGLDPYALYIDSLILAKKGRLFTASAGNSGHWEKYHLHTDVTSDTSFTWFEVNDNFAFGGKGAYWELWSDTASFNDVSYAFGMDQVDPSYSFRGRTAFTQITDNLNQLTSDTIFSSGLDTLAIIQTWAERRDGQYLLQVLIQDPDSSDYNIRFETFGSGTFDVWSISNYGMSRIVDTIPTVAEYPEISKYINPDSLQSIVSSFQCSPHVITVGNYANDSGYVNKYGVWRSSNFPRGELASSSSKGPSRLGLIKPEVCATGQTTTSTAPLHVIDNVVTNNLDSVLAYGGMHMSNGGTSMASPIVAGVGSLLLEKCNNISQEDYRNAIINNTYTDGFTGSNLPNNAWGYGKLDGIASMLSTNFTPSYIGDTIFCEGGNTTITLDQTLASVVWQSGNNSHSDVFIDSAQTYIIAIDTLGCLGDTLHLNIIEAPNPNTPVLSYQFDSIIAPAGFSNYSWDLNGVFYQNTYLDSVLVVSQNGNYFVTVTNEYGCVSTSDVFIYNSANIDDLTLEFSAYPNPSDGNVFIKSNFELELISVWDATGRQINQFTNLNKLDKIDLTMLPNGVYWLTFKASNQQFVQKIVLNK